MLKKTKGNYLEQKRAASIFNPCFSLLGANVNTVPVILWLLSCKNKLSISDIHLHKKFFSRKINHRICRKHLNIYNLLEDFFVLSLPRMTPTYRFQLNVSNECFRNQGWDTNEADSCGTYGWYDALLALRPSSASTNTINKLKPNSTNIGMFFKC